MLPLMFRLGKHNRLFQDIVDSLDAETGVLECRRFPDGESYVRVLANCKDRRVMVFCPLEQPDSKVVPLLLVADTLRDLGASEIVLVAPYLAYMRQDTRFRAGEGVTARYFAQLLSRYFDRLITVDPHLHRFHSLEEIYSIPTNVVRSAPLIANWINDYVTKPVLIGPDNESEQWVAAVAALARAPYCVLEKVRSGDREVQVSIPELDEYSDRSPVLVDDIISTGRTLASAVAHLVRMERAAPICVGVHAVFSDDAMRMLEDAGVARIVTTNTILHRSNAIDLAPAIAAAVR